MPLRGLTADQIYDSFLAATGARDLAPRNQRFFDPRNDAGRSAFRNLFQRAVFATDLLPWEDPSLVGDPERVDVDRVLHARLTTGARS